MCCPAPPRHALGGSDGGGWTVNVVKFILAEEGYTCANACACQGLSCDDGHWGIYDERTFRSNLQAALNLDRVHAEDMCRSGYAPSASASAPLLHTGQSHECNFAPGNTQCALQLTDFLPALGGFASALDDERMRLQAAFLQPLREEDQQAAGTE